MYRGTDHRYVYSNQQIAEPDWLTDFRLLRRDRTHAVQFTIGLT